MWTADYMQPDVADSCSIWCVVYFNMSVDIAAAINIDSIFISMSFCTPMWSEQCYFKGIMISVLICGHMARLGDWIVKTWQNSVWAYNCSEYIDFLNVYICHSVAR